MTLLLPFSNINQQQQHHQNGKKTQLPDQDRPQEVYGVCILRVGVYWPESDTIRYDVYGAKTSDP